MGKRYLIDTNVIIGYLDNQIPQQGMKFLNELIDDEINISVINKIELLRFNTSKEVYQILKNFVEVSHVYNLDDNIIDETTSICKSHKIKLPDALIAATARANDFVLLTRNTNDFKETLGVETINPWKL